MPESLVESFLQYCNSTLGGHLGQLKTLLRLLEIAWWPTICHDVWQYVKSCTICQRYNLDNKKPTSEIQQTMVETAGEMLEVDLMGPLPHSKTGDLFLLVVVDY